MLSELWYYFAAKFPTTSRVLTLSKIQRSRVWIPTGKSQITIFHNLKYIPFLKLKWCPKSKLWIEVQVPVYEVKNIIIQEYQALWVHERPILQKMPKGQIVLYGKLEFSIQISWEWFQNGVTVVAEANQNLAGTVADETNHWTENWRRQRRRRMRRPLRRLDPICLLQYYLLAFLRLVVL